MLGLGVVAALAETNAPGAADEPGTTTTIGADPTTTTTTVAADEATTTTTVAADDTTTTTVAAPDAPDAPDAPATHPDNHGATVSEAAHDHSHDAECGNHGAWVSSVAHGESQCTPHTTGHDAATSQDETGATSADAHHGNVHH